jgi:hypothetical protein
LAALGIKGSVEKAAALLTIFDTRAVTGMNILPAE